MEEGKDGLRGGGKANKTDFIHQPPGSPARPQGSLVTPTPKRDSPHKSSNPGLSLLCEDIPTWWRTNSVSERVSERMRARGRAQHCNEFSHE